MPAPSPDPPAGGSPLAGDRRVRGAGSQTTSEELHLAAERWAAMIVDAYLRHLTTAAESEEEP